MKILKIILILAGIALIALGLYNAFMPQEVMPIDIITTDDTTRSSSQISGMIGLGIVALVAGTFLKNRR